MTFQGNYRDSLQQQKQNYNLGASNSQGNSRTAMQNLYKNQLDSLVQQKHKQRQIQKQRQVQQKRQYNQRLKQNKQAEKMKQLSYKNYYSMLLNNQQHNQDSYVSPAQNRDKMKTDHINFAVQEEEKRVQAWEIEQRRRQTDKRNNYKNQLMHQIEQRKRRQSQYKSYQSQKKQQFKRYSQLPQQISKFERQRKRQDMNKYKEDLDKVRLERDVMRNSPSLPQNIKVSEDRHNILTNPLPYNIQNPYIIRQMRGKNTQGISQISQNELPSSRQNNIF